ncbi:MAG TPA: hypothetical protein ENG42_02085 [Candidatus Aenigmarchaeota archaeon]|nr:MAG: hypothetical protein DRP03_01740 [Candidatus Aenigmarchaeota archaeon]HDD46237.1 hypothetical protein [Candidatus Aenigmarchaeota archaeon]
MKRLYHVEIEGDIYFGDLYRGEEVPYYIDIIVGFTHASSKKQALLNVLRKHANSDGFLLGKPVGVVYSAILEQYPLDDIVREVVKDAGKHSKKIEEAGNKKGKRAQQLCFQF